MIGKSWTVIAAIAVLTLGAMAGALAGEKATVASDTPRYDANAEYVVKATVTGVKTHQSVMGYEDTHLMVNTSVGEMEVHVGPTAYLAKRGFQVKAGDAIVVTCCKATYEDKPVLVAREIKHGEQSITVRNTSGQATWPKNISS